MSRDIFSVIKRPVITEKATDATGSNQYTFEVLRQASKVEIRQALETIYKVKVDSVNTMRVKGKWRRVGRSYGRTPDWKKAIVTLKEGQTIDLM